MLGLPGEMWSTMQIAARRSTGKPLTTRDSHFDATCGGADHDEVAMTVRLRVASVPFHTNSVRSVRVPYQLAGRHPGVARQR